VTDELLLVGSIPLDTPKDVFETFGAPLGKYLFAMPDGEVGPRRHWISRVHYQVLAGHPELEVVQHPAPDRDGVERQAPRNAADAWWFKVKDGVEQPLRRSGMAPRLRARRLELLFRVPDHEGEGRPAGASAFSGLGADGQQRAAATHFSRPG
jgi:hypothetical protein